ncbi:hypothetical protein ABBQ32_000379 [Trebouxia sp. C0010 RCD-2024]
MFEPVGNEGLQEYVADVKASNRTKGQKGKTEATSVVSSVASAESRVTSEGSGAIQGQPQAGHLELAESLAESLPSQPSLAPRVNAVSLDGGPRGGKVTLPPLPPGLIPRKRAASASGVDVQVLEGPDSESLQPKPTMQQISLPGSTGAPSSDPAPALTLDPSNSSAALEAAPISPSQAATFKQINAGKPKGVTKRAQFGSMYMPASHSSINRPTYAQDAVDEDNADAKASGIFSVTNRTDGAQGSGSGGHRGGYEAYSSMAFAQGGVPQQHVTANDMPSPETDVQRNDLAPDASLSMSLEAGSNGGGMGSLTGWQALANEIMMEGEEEEGNDDIGRQSRDIGSLTGWQALANEVIAELGSGPQPASQQALGSDHNMGNSDDNMQVKRKVLHQTSGIQTKGPSKTGACNKGGIPVKGASNNWGSKGGHGQKC